MNSTKKKLKVGWFSFTCCEDSTIIFTEMLNDYFDTWREIFEFSDIRVLKTKHSDEPLDIAFVEGAISGKDEEENVKKIRARAKKVVAIGACACVGMPSAQRNTFTPEQKGEIQFLLDRFAYLENVQSLKQVIPVDAEVPGCPMNEQTFLQVVDTVIKELKDS